MDVRGRTGEARLPSTFRARVSLSDRQGMGVAVNLSSEGLCLHTDLVFRTGQQVNLGLEVPEVPDAVLLSTEVRWVREVSPLLEPLWTYEAGLLVRDPPPQYLELVEQYSRRFLDQRDDPRFPREMRVQLSGPGTWEMTYARNIGRRGLFIRTRQPVPPGALVEIQLYLPGLDRPVPMRAEVVHHVTAEKAVLVGSEPGIGVRLGSVPEWAREAYLAFLRTLEAGPSR
ncbi:MAG TPA: PilZ domain-containing protein [Myxococcota bacterium]|nr:PilZ domain-containing protein [Myxococcota bacterium]HQK52081.1 PilZ domain-containing protein [Myxococcota bacterium]